MSGSAVSACPSDISLPSSTNSLDFCAASYRGSLSALTVTRLLSYRKKTALNFNKKFLLKSAGADIPVTVLSLSSKKQNTDYLALMLWDVLNIKHTWQTLWTPLAVLFSLLLFQHSSTQNTEDLTPTPAAVIAEHWLSFHDPWNQAAFVPFYKHLKGQGEKQQWVNTPSTWDS